MARDRRSIASQGRRQPTPDVDPLEPLNFGNEETPEPRTKPHLRATGDGIWVHDTHTDPVLEYGDEVTLPRTSPRLESEIKPTKKLDLIPRLPPRPTAPPAGFSARGTLKMAPAASTEACLPLPPPLIPRPPSGPAPIEIGAFDDSTDSKISLPSVRPPTAKPAALPIWLFAMLALASAGLAGVGYAFIADAGPFARGVSEGRDAALHRPAAPASAAKALIENHAVVPPVATSIAATAASTAPTQSSTQASSQGTPPEAAAPLILSAAPAPAITSAPSSEAVSATSLPLAPAADLSALLSYQGYLTVHSSAAADVVVQGVAAGRTNEPLLVRCGPRNVRLRDGAQWITEGQHVHIDCMQLTEVTIAPTQTAGMH